MKWNLIKENPYYLISNTGSVKSIDRKYHKGKILKSRLRANGYYYVSLSLNGIVKDKTIHRLVAQAFIPNPDYKKCVNHKDCNKLNNVVANLEWVTHGENQKHAIENNLTAWGEKQAISKLREGDVRTIRSLYFGGVYNQPTLARAYGVTQPTIWNIVHYKTWRQL